MTPTQMTITAQPFRDMFEICWFNAGTWLPVINRQLESEVQHCCDENINITCQLKDWFQNSCFKNHILDYSYSSSKCLQKEQKHKSAIVYMIISIWLQVSTLTIKCLCSHYTTCMLPPIECHLLCNYLLKFTNCGTNDIPLMVYSFRAGVCIRWCLFFIHFLCQPVPASLNTSGCKNIAYVA